eukprot:6468909-Amphidinium_carterae.1
MAASEEVVQAMRAMQEQLLGMQQQVQQQNAEIQRQANEIQLAQAQATPVGGVQQQAPVDAKHPLAGISRWAPDFFKGDVADWRQWSSKFRAFVGAMHGGQVGKWLDIVEQNRGTSALKAVLGAGCESASATLHAALIQVVEGRAFVIVDRSGGGEGLEAW